MKHYIHLESPMGTLTAVSEDGYLIELNFNGLYIPNAAYGADEVLLKTKLWLERYFSSEQPEFQIPLKPRGTAFQNKVWSLLKRIPHGQAETYGSLAKQLDNPKMSAQAVGQAIGRNPIPILIPCHRVLGAGNTLTGYAGGLDRKKFLLELEHIEYR